MASMAQQPSCFALQWRPCLPSHPAGPSSLRLASKPAACPRPAAGYFLCKLGPSLRAAPAPGEPLEPFARHKACSSAKGNGQLMAAEHQGAKQRQCKQEQEESLKKEAKESGYFRALAGTEAPERSPSGQQISPVARSDPAPA